MSKTNSFETAWLTYIFNGTDLANIGDAGGLRDDPGGNGSLYVALYTVSPTDSGIGTECDYTNYARVAVARTAGGWTITNSNVANAGAITFPTAGATVTDIAVAVAVHGQLAGDTILYYGTLDSSLSISTGVTPAFAIGELDIDDI